MPPPPHAFRTPLAPRRTSSHTSKISASATQPHKRHPLSISTLPSPPCELVSLHSHSPSHSHSASHAARSARSPPTHTRHSQSQSPRSPCSPRTPTTTRRTPRTLRTLRTPRALSLCPDATGAPDADADAESRASPFTTTTNTSSTPSCLALAPAPIISPSNPISRTALPSFSPHSYSRSSSPLYDLGASLIPLLPLAIPMTSCSRSDRSDRQDRDIRHRTPISSPLLSLFRGRDGPGEVHDSLDSHDSHDLHDSQGKLSKSPHIRSSLLVFGPSMSMSDTPCGSGGGMHHPLLDLDIAIDLSDIDSAHSAQRGLSKPKRNARLSPSSAVPRRPLSTHSRYQTDHLGPALSQHAMRRFLSLVLWVVLGMFISLVVLGGNQSGLASLSRSGRGAIVEVTTGSGVRASGGGGFKGYINDEGTYGVGGVGGEKGEWDSWAVAGAMADGEVVGGMRDVEDKRMWSVNRG